MINCSTSRSSADEPEPWSGSGAMSLLVVLLAALAFGQRQTARDLAAQLSGISLARQLASDSGHVINDEPDLAILLAIEAIRATESTGEALPEAVDALHWALQAATIEYPADESGSSSRAAEPIRAPRCFRLPPGRIGGSRPPAAGRGFSAAECERYFPQVGCPPTEPHPARSRDRRRLDLYQSLRTMARRLAGTRVVVTGGWSGLETEVASEALTAFGTGWASRLFTEARAWPKAPSTPRMSERPGDIVFRNRAPSQKSRRCDPLSTLVVM